MKTRSTRNENKEFTNGGTTEYGQRLNTHLDSSFVQGGIKKHRRLEWGEGFGCMAAHSHIMSESIIIFLTPRGTRYSQQETRTYYLCVIHRK